MQGALKKSARHVENLERRLKEVEGFKGQAELFKVQLQELEVGIPKSRIPPF